MSSNKKAKMRFHLWKQLQVNYLLVGDVSTALARQTFWKYWLVTNFKSPEMETQTTLLIQLQLIHLLDLYCSRYTVSYSNMSALLLQTPLGMYETRNTYFNMGTTGILFTTANTSKPSVKVRAGGSSNGLFPKGTELIVPKKYSCSFHLISSAD